MHRKISIAVIVSAVLLSAAFISAGVWFSSFRERIQLSMPIDQYRRAETQETTLFARRWMNFAIELQKDLNLGPSLSARLYAYTASTYADVLEKTGDVQAAGAATALILQELLPQYLDRIATFHASVHGGSPLVTGDAQEILTSYVARSRNDGASLEWDESMLPASPNAWFVRALEDYSLDRIPHQVRGNFTPVLIDDGARSGEWAPWIVRTDPDGVPPPPKRGSVADAAEMEKVRYGVRIRTLEDKATVTFWHGAGGFFKGQERDNIGSAVWQNILFVEEGDVLSEKEYARAQKMLAQAIADAFIYAWKVKYAYYIPRPSMRMPDLDVAVADPPFPSYVSGHSTISYAAAEILTTLFPEKRDLWEGLARDAKNSRLLAGIHFDSDNSVGGYYGAAIGRTAAQGFGLSPEGGTVPAYRSPSLLENTIAWIALRTDRLLHEWDEAKRREK